MVGLEFVVSYVAVGYWQRGVVSVGDFCIQTYLIR
jgi:hypothetical protein